MRRGNHERLEERRKSEMKLENNENMKKTKEEKTPCKPENMLKAQTI